MNSPKKTGKDPKLIASAILIALIVIAAIVLVGTRLTGSDDSPTARQPQTTSGPKTSDSSSACGLPDGDQTIPTEAPKAKWELSGKVAAPRSKAFGPAAANAQTQTCFAHNPTGAVFAAANYLADSANPDISTKTLIAERIYEDGTSSPKVAERSAEQDRPTLQISGFRVEDSTQDRVSVTVVVRATEGATAGQNYALTFTMAWQRGDWRIVNPASGQPPTSAVASLAGFTPWSGA